MLCFVLSRGMNKDVENVEEAIVRVNPYLSGK